MGQSSDGLEGFLAFFPSIGIEIGINYFSVFSTSKGSFLTLGPASFINSSCRPVCIYVSCLKTGSARIIFIEANGIAPNDQIFVRYGGGFSGSNYEDCMCPHTEFHGDHVRVYESRTRSGLTSREFLVEVTSNEATGSANF